MTLSPLYKVYSLAMVKAMKKVYYDFQRTMKYKQKCMIPWFHIQQLFLQGISYRRFRFITEGGKIVSDVAKNIGVTETSVRR